MGSINVDLAADTERLPLPGETVAGHRFTIAPGGKGANQALAARRAGSDVRLVGAVGNDRFAAISLEILKAEGVDLSATQVFGNQTGTAVIYVAANGENMIAVVPGANASVSTSQALEAVDAMNSGDMLMLQLEIPAATIERAIEAARRKGVRTVLNTAPLTKEAIELARSVDILVANETEYDLLVGRNPGQSDRAGSLRALHAENGQTIVVTLGAEGVVAIHQGEIVSVKGLKIDPVDTVGAGDTFCGYFASSLDHGLALPDALRRAAVAGSLACLSSGAQPAIPARLLVEANL
nr:MULTISPECIES: ribokinase [unclassified Rhizobium]